MPELIDEIKEDIKQERLEKIWEKHGNTVISIIVLVVLSTAAGVWFKGYSVSKNESQGDALYKSYVNAEFSENKAQAYDDVLSELSSPYSAIAKMQKAKSSLSAGANVVYDEIASDSDSPEEIKQLAFLIKASSQNSEENNNLLRKIIAQKGIYADSAKEKLAFNNLENGNLLDAKAAFEELATLQISAASRAQEMLLFIKSQESSDE